MMDYVTESLVPEDFVYREILLGCKFVLLSQSVEHPG